MKLASSRFCLSFFLMTLLMVCSSKAFAYKISIYTDEPNELKAKDVLKSFRTTYPFNQFELDIEIRPVAAEMLNCGPRYGIERNIGCDADQRMAREAASRGIDQVLVVKNSTVYGGSGGSLAVMTSSSPTSMMLHEYLHTLGLCDEYEYAAEETIHYCDGAAGPNMVFIAPNPAGYSSDGNARSEHMGQIPWSDFIRETTLITNTTNLGTGSVDPGVYATPNTSNSPSAISSAIGLYKGRTCKLATPPKATWQPGREATIMEFLDAGLGAGNEAIIAKILDSKGVRRKPVPPIETPVAVNDNHSREPKESVSNVIDSRSNTNSNVSR